MKLSSAETTFEDVFASCYVPGQEVIIPFGDRWCGPDKYEHAEEHLIATYEGVGDGQSVEVYCCAMPATFWTIKVLAGENSVNEPQPAYSVGTGSGGMEMAIQVANMAQLIAEGMLGFHPDIPDCEGQKPI